MGHNYCGWECSVGHAKSRGGAVHSPNGLPVRSIRFDDSMWEHEHADHPGYMFPVEVRFVGELPDEWRQYHVAMHGRELTDEEFRDSEGQTHALVFLDGCVALTMYECCYALWRLDDGSLLHGSLWRADRWRLDVGTVGEGLARRPELVDATHVTERRSVASYLPSKGRSNMNVIFGNYTFTAQDNANPVVVSFAAQPDTNYTFLLTLESGNAGTGGAIEDMPQAGMPYPLIRKYNDHVELYFSPSDSGANPLFTGDAYVVNYVVLHA